MGGHKCMHCVCWFGTCLTYAQTAWVWMVWAPVTVLETPRFWCVSVCFFVRVCVSEGGGGRLFWHVRNALILVYVCMQV